MKQDWFKKDRNRKVNRALCIIIGIAGLLLLCGALLWKRNERLRFVENMGHGINLGNTLDATNLRDFVPDAGELEYETFWGNPKITREQLAAIRRAGFKTVRIPVTFEDHLDGSYHISEIWMTRVTEVIQMALDEELYVVMDLHGDEWLDLQVNNKENIKAQFEKVWKQIAVQFRDFDQHLILEGMNEPRLRESEYEWTEGTPELRDFVNELNQLFVDTVRTTGGMNETRYLMVCPYCNGAWEKTAEALTVPKGNIIVAVHLYRPYQFCQNKQGTAEWSRDNRQDVAEAEESFKLMSKTFVKRGIPVIFTEYGCVDKENLEARMEWAQFYMELSETYRIPCIWWDNGSTYQLLDRENNQWKYPELADIIAGKKE